MVGKCAPVNKSKLDELELRTNRCFNLTVNDCLINFKWSHDKLLAREPSMKSIIL